MDALNSLDIRRKEGRVVHLVLKQNPSNFVSDKLRRLYLVVLLVEIVVLKAAGYDSQLQVTSINNTLSATVIFPHVQGLSFLPRLKTCIARHLTPHLESVRVHHVFRAGLLILFGSLAHTLTRR